MFKLQPNQWSIKQFNTHHPANQESDADAARLLQWPVKTTSHIRPRTVWTCPEVRTSSQHEGRGSRRTPWQWWSQTCCDRGVDAAGNKQTNKQQCGLKDTRGSELRELPEAFSYDGWTVENKCSGSRSALSAREEPWVTEVNVKQLLTVALKNRTKHRSYDTSGLVMVVEHKQ